MAVVEEQEERSELAKQLENLRDSTVVEDSLFVQLAKRVASSWPEVPVFASLCFNVEIGSKGRMAVAAEAIKGKSVVFEEAPLVRVVDRHLGVTCGHCGRKKILVQCPTCRLAYFCEGCTSNQVHQKECNLVLALSAFCTFSKEQLAGGLYVTRLYDLLKSSPSDTSAILLLQSNWTKYRHLGKYGPHYEPARIALHLLHPDTLEDDSLAHSRLKDTWTTLQILSAISQTNAYLVGWEDTTQETETGLFLHISLLNHSCYPNCKLGRIGADGRVPLVALKDIPKGTELTTNYFPATRDVVARHEQLKEAFFFNCDPCPPPPSISGTRIDKLSDAEVAALVEAPQDKDNKKPAKSQSKKTKKK